LQHVPGNLRLNGIRIVHKGRRAYDATPENQDGEEYDDQLIARAHSLLVQHSFRMIASGYYFLVRVFTKAGQVLLSGGEEQENDIASDSIIGSSGCERSGMAVQPGVGLLSKRRPGACRTDPGDPVADGAHLGTEWRGRWAWLAAA
jgi:hypothetical protein